MADPIFYYSQLQLAPVANNTSKDPLAGLHPVDGKFVFKGTGGAQARSVTFDYVNGHATNMKATCMSDTVVPPLKLSQQQADELAAKFIEGAKTIILADRSTATTVVQNIKGDTEKTKIALNYQEEPAGNSCKNPGATPATTKPAAKKAKG